MERKQWIDNAKAIGIILVVVGHVGGVPNDLKNLIYSFHMPLFFFLSGLVYKTSSKKYIFKQTKKLLSIYLFLSIAFSISYQVMTGMTVNCFDEIWYLLTGFYPGGNPAGILWFLLTLWTVSAIIHMVCSHIKDEWLRYTLVILFFIVGFAMADNQLHFLLRVQTALIGCIFFFVGHKCSSLLEKMQSFSRTMRLFVLLAACCFVVLSTRCNGRVDMESDRYGNPFLFLIGSFAGILIVTVISHSIPNRNKCMQTIGQNSMVIYLLHVYPVMIINFVLEKGGFAPEHIAKLLSHLATYALIAVVIVCKEKARNSIQRENRDMTINE